MFRKSVRLFLWVSIVNGFACIKLGAAHPNPSIVSGLGSCFTLLLEEFPFKLIDFGHLWDQLERSSDFSLAHRADRGRICALR